MKKCIKCEKIKQLDSFYKRNDRKDRYSSSCIECQRKYLKEHYHKNIKYYKAKARKNDINAIEQRFHFLVDYLKNNPCVDCGEGDIVVLQFDHVRGKKFRNISMMLHRKMSWEKILLEIKKCEVRCSNCHVRKTARQFNWKKLHV